jgi:hypothetical protein
MERVSSRERERIAELLAESRTKHACGSTGAARRTSVERAPVGATTGDPPDHKAVLLRDHRLPERRRSGHPNDGGGRGWRGGRRRPALRCARGRSRLRRFGEDRCAIRQLCATIASVPAVLESVAERTREKFGDRLRNITTRIERLDLVVCRVALDHRHAEHDPHAFAPRQDRTGHLADGEDPRATVTATGDVFDGDGGPGTRVEFQERRRLLAAAAELLLPLGSFEPRDNDRFIESVDDTGDSVLPPGLKQMPVALSIKPMGATPPTN